MQLKAGFLEILDIVPGQLVLNHLGDRVAIKDFWIVNALVRVEKFPGYDVSRFWKIPLPALLGYRTGPPQAAGKEYDNGNFDPAAKCIHGIII